MWWYLISENVGPSFIVLLSEKNDVLIATSCFLQNFGFSQVICFVNGTHIPINQLSENTPDYLLYVMLHIKLTGNMRWLWKIYQC